MAGSASIAIAQEVTGGPKKVMGVPWYVSIDSAKAILLAQPGVTIDDEDSESIEIEGGEFAGFPVEDATFEFDKFGMYKATVGLAKMAVEPMLTQERIAEEITTKYNIQPKKGGSKIATVTMPTYSWLLGTVSLFMYWDLRWSFSALTLQYTNHGAKVDEHMDKREAIQPKSDDL